MKIETILNAYDKAYQVIIAEAGGWLLLSFEHISKRKRQHTAFRARILRMGNDSEEAYYNGVSAGMDVRGETIRQKDAEIAWCKRELDLERRINLEESDD